MKICFRFQLCRRERRSMPISKMGLEFFPVGVRSMGGCRTRPLFPVLLQLMGIPFCTTLVEVICFRTVSKGAYVGLQIAKDVSPATKQLTPPMLSLPLPVTQMPTTNPPSRNIPPLLSVLHFDNITTIRAFERQVYALT